MAIKEGIYKTVQTARDHFENLYPIAKKYEYFLYDSSKLGQRSGRQGQLAEEGVFFSPSAG